MLFLSVILSILADGYFLCDNPNQISILPPFNNLNNVKLKLGENLNIICCHPDGAKYLKWMNHESKIILSDSTNPVFTLRDEKDRLILRFNGVEASHLGTYTCQNNKNNVYKSISISKAEKSYAPKVIKLSKDFPKNKPILINCPITVNQIFKSWVYSIGGANVEISKPGSYESFEISQNKSQFKIIKQIDQFVRVWCLFQEVSGNGDIKNGQYEIKWTLYDPIDTRIQISNKDIIKVGDEVKLTCYYRLHKMQSVNFPVPYNAKFKKDTINSKEGKYVITIKKITKDSEGIYKCVVTNIINPPPSLKAVSETARVELKVVVAPTIINKSFIDKSVKIGKTAILQCETKVMHLQEEKFYFMKFNKTTNGWIRISDNNDARYNIKITKKNDDFAVLNLTIKNVNWSDRGKYKCVVNNPIGEATSESKFKVSRKPELNTNSSEVFVGINPIIVPCHVSGFPIINSKDVLQLRLLNNIKSIKIEFKKRIFDDIDGLTHMYKVSRGSNVNTGADYKLQCYYSNIKDKYEETKNIVLKIAGNPSPPKIEVLCYGSSGVAFKYLMSDQMNKNEQIETLTLYYAPISEFDKLTTKPQNTFPIKEEDKNNKYKIFVLGDLMPDTVYQFKLEATNMFRMSSNKLIKGKTQNLSPPNKPKSVTFLRLKAGIQVNVTWDSSCSYPGVNSDVEDVLVKMQSTDGTSSHYEWVERNFTMDSNSNSLRFKINMDGPQRDYHVQIAVRSLMGTSDYRKELLQPYKIKAAAICYPFCGNAAHSTFYSSHYLVLLQSIIMTILAIALF